MERENCYMTFSQALEQYLAARDAINHFGEGYNRFQAYEDMKEARELMDALTNSQDKS